MRHAPLRMQRPLSVARWVIPALLSILMLIPAGAVAHEDWMANLESFEKIYTAGDPIGRIRLTYSAWDADKPVLALECGLFKGTVPAAGLTDLPGPNWHSIVVAYSTSTTPMVVGERNPEPYVYVLVPLGGPRGEAWEQTWVTFHFDSRGVTRKIKHYVPDPATNSIGGAWVDWPISSGITAQQALRQPRQ